MVVRVASSPLARPTYRTPGACSTDDRPSPPRPGGCAVTAPVYPATPYLRRLTAANGWRHELIGDEHGHPLVIVAVRVGATWTDSVAIEGEDRCVAMRHRTDSDRLIVPTGLPGGSGAVWRRDGRCDDVLAELFELPEPGGLWVP